MRRHTSVSVSPYMVLVSEAGARQAEERYSVLGTSRQHADEAATGQFNQEKYLD